MSEATLWLRSACVTAFCIAGLLTMVGCAAFGGPPIQDQLTFCQGAQPLRPAKGETANLSDKLVGQIHEQNELGRKVCGWKPGG